MEANKNSTADEQERTDNGQTRRQFLGAAAAASALLAGDAAASDSSSLGHSSSEKEKGLDDVWSSGSIGFDTGRLNVSTRGAISYDGDQEFPAVELVFGGEGLHLTMSLDRAEVSALTDELRSELKKAERIYKIEQVRERDA